MLDYVWQHRGALWNLAGLILALGVFINWMAWVFRFGRFAQPAAPAPNTQPLRFVVGSFFAEIINDFRHFLALVIVLLFAFTLFLAMLPGIRAQDMATLTDGVQTVAAALGGLIGSIIGYYFGESAATRSVAGAAPAVSDTRPPVQDAPPPDQPVAGMVPAPQPPDNPAQGG